MDEARRFLRYILPGLVFSVLLLIFLLISDTDKTICFLKEASDKGIAGVIAGTFLASGALGYIFSVIYWALYWSWPLINYIAIDHKSLLKELTRKRKIKIVNISGNTVLLDENSKSKKSKRKAWVIFSQHWWASMIKNDIDKDKFIPIDRLADITHAIGTAFIGILFLLITCITWVIIHFCYLKSEFSIFKVLVFITLLILLLLAFGRNYWVTHRFLQSVLNSAFANIVENQFKKNVRRKIEIYYSK